MDEALETLISGYDLCIKIQKREKSVNNLTKYLLLGAGYASLGLCIYSFTEKEYFTAAVEFLPACFFGWGSLKFNRMYSDNIREISRLESKKKELDENK